ncbi:hypothetical protein HYH03_014411 [Edaphochlamys debaryana]|uniref:Uncharacterized protein n=1 Tax=Edaphochlamys debaryana TaxID=47281 RepID=A0A836BS96_9CHLO|nr:hypothetical protein HYH03_014411 [Edaphochlamys debaryana]|eukprot:KAG2486912.1 hypothetical protein HYH03_014411 [Edaphochlamys debaryana]
MIQASHPDAAAQAQAVLSVAKKATILQDLFISSLSVSGATLFTNPLDVIKTRLQLHRRSTVPGVRPPGLVRTGVMLVREEGVLGLWKGLTPALARGFVYGGMRLGLYAPTRDLLETLASATSDGATGGLAAVGLKVAAGTLSGALAAGLTSPTELVKTRLQAKDCSAKGPVEVALQVVKADGPLGLWRGAVPSMVRAGLLTASQVATYDTVKREVLMLSGWGDCLATHLTSSLISGVVVTTATNPADVIKTKMFVGGASSGRSIVQVAGDIVREDGAMGFLKGWSANYARLGPQTVIIFVISEALRSAMGLQGL